MADNTPQNGTANIGADDVTTLNGAGSSGVLIQRVKPSWGSDGTATDVDANNPLPMSINASVFKFSTNNSTTAGLASGATFTGTIETTLDQPSISLLVTSDQPITLKVQQFADISMTLPVPDIIYYIEAGKGLSASLPINGNYVRVTATNTGTSATTLFSLNTAYGNIPTSDGSGRLPVSVSDCVQLLTQTLTTPTASTVIDTQGYQAVVVQISGIFSGLGLFESSVDGSTDSYQKCFYLTDGELTLESQVVRSGQFIVRPAGRYLRLNMTKLSGSMTIKAIGRTASTMSADQSLALAMDPRNEAPMYMQLNDRTIGQLARAQALTQVGYFRQDGILPINMVLLTVDCTKYASLSVQFSTGATGVAQPQWSNDGSTWVSMQHWDTSQALTGTFGASQTGLRIVNVSARYYRIIATTAYTSGVTFFMVYGSQQLMAPPNATQAVSGTVTANIGTGSIAAGTNAIGDVGVQYRGSATGAAIMFKFTAAATTNGASVKASAGRVIGYMLYNTTASVKFFRFYNKASAPTVGTDSPYFVVAVPPNSTAATDLEGGIAFTTGIAIACTGAVADLDTTVTAANDVIGAVFYA